MSFLKDFFVTENMPFIAAITTLANAILTVSLTTLISTNKERKTNKISKRVFLNHSNYTLAYPLNSFELEMLGEGIMYVSKIHKKGPAECEYKVLTNMTENDLLNVNIRIKHNDIHETIDEFSRSYWENSEVMYILLGEGKSIFNQEFEIRFTTMAFENFLYTFKKNRKGEYEEKLVLKRFYGLASKEITRIIKRKQDDFFKLSLDDKKN